MKTLTSILRCILFAVTALYPTGSLICACFGYRFVLNNITAYSVLMAILSVSMVAFTFILKEQVENRTSIILQSLLLPLALINAFLYPHGHSTFLVLVCVTVALGSAFFLVLGPRKRLVIKIITLVLSAVLSLHIGCFSGFLMLFGDIGHVAVVQTVESPGGQYRAEVLDIDQGALGGDTVVDVYENNKHYEFFLFTISKKPQRVYIGNWGEFESMRISWKDEHCLVINSKAYHID